MTLLSKVLAKLGRQRSSNDPSRAEPSGTGAAQSTTGTGESGTSVGRVAGQDEGYLETGAEKRAEMDAEEDNGTS